VRTAIVHYWLLNRRGGEKVLEAICRLLPEADIFTLFCDRASLTPEIARHRITTSFLNPLRRGYRSLLPLMPMALESFDLRGYDLIVSSESGPAKGVITSSSTRHICYCHTPMRYLWDLYPAYRNEWTRSFWKRAAMAPLSNYLRLWDFASAARVDRFVANSRHVQERVWKTYRRESEVVYPPVNIDMFHWRPDEGYYLIVSELVPYKRIDYAVRAFARNGRRLRIVGDGPEYSRLKRRAASNVEFCGRVPDGELREIYARSRAFILPGEEDFGIAPVEALASGKPVLALGRGGALETVPPFGGVTYAEPEEDYLQQALARLDQLEPGISPARLQAWAGQFSEREFMYKMADCLGLADPAMLATADRSAGGAARVS
jgi:glycosyltransferase involved in cell wall biosynthesis